MSECKQGEIYKLLLDLLKKYSPMEAMLSVETLLITYFLGNGLEKEHFMSRMNVAFDDLEKEYKEFLQRENNEPN